jgi:hypothetical protein
MFIYEPLLVSGAQTGTLFEFVCAIYRGIAVWMTIICYTVKCVV